MRLNGKVAIITGCANGIGRASAELFAKEGARLVINDLTEAIFELESQLKENGCEAVAVQGSVTEYAVVERLVDAALSNFGKIDILVNTVALSARDSILETTIEDFDRISSTNLKAIFYPCKAVLPHMVERRYGHIVNLSSVAGIRGGGLLGKSTYACTKGATIALTKGIAREVAPYGINCNVVCPGFTITSRTAAEKPETVERILKAIPLGRGAAASEIANTVLFLASDESSFTTGSVHVVDGGVTMV